MDNQRCNLGYLMEHMKYRASLPNAKFICIGDMGDWIFAGDPRFTYDNMKHLSDRQDVIMERIEWISKKLAPFPWLLIGSGNHETKILKKHFIAPGKEIAKNTGVPYGGYTGYLVLHLIPTSEKHSRDKVIILYHHGAWGGKLDSGYGKARDYARHFDNFDIFCYGHNHNIAIKPEPRMTVQGGKVIVKPRWYVNTGSFLESFVNENPDETITNYVESGGYSPAITGAPLIKITVHRLHTNISIEAAFNK
jgi:hypothetical protein